MCEAIERPELASDPRFADNSARRDNHTRWMAINAPLRTRHGLTGSNAERTQCSMCTYSHAEEATSHPQTEAVEMVQTHPETGFFVFGIPLC